MDLDLETMLKLLLSRAALAEITRLGVKLGANPLTYSGLSGVGDLIVTGTSVHSRNWRAGDALWAWRSFLLGRYRSKYGNGH